MEVRPAYPFYKINPSGMMLLRPIRLAEFQTQWKNVCISGILRRTLSIFFAGVL